MLLRLNGREKVRGQRKVGLALSGGGLRGVAHIGVLSAFLKAGIPIDFISGTSAGAIIAALYTSGYTPQQMSHLALRLKPGELVDFKLTLGDVFKHSIKWLMGRKGRFWSALPTGLIKGDRIERYLTELLHERTVRDTKIPVAITAVDLLSADTVFFTTPQPGKRAILHARYYHNTPLVEAVRASISIPGVFHPKSYRGMILVDGAVKNNLPTDVLRHMGADVTVAVDLGYDGQPVTDMKTVGDILLQCIEIMGREVTLLKGREHADILIRPDMYEIAVKDTRYIQMGIERGEQAARHKIGEIKKLL